MLLTTCILPHEPASSRIELQFIGDTLFLGINGKVTPPVAVFADGTRMADARLRFESGDSSIVVVDDSGRIVGRRRGVTLVRAILQSAVTSDLPPDTSLAVRVVVGSLVCRLDPLNPLDTLVALGDTTWVRCGARDVNGVALSPEDSAAIRPRYYRLPRDGDSTDTDRAVAVDSLTGAVMAIANGTDSVRAEVDASHVDLPVVVEQRVDSIEILPAEPTLTAINETIELEPVAYDSRGSPVAIPKPFRWTSGDGSVATVDSLSGLVTAVDSGEVWIRVTAEGGLDSSRIVVSPQATYLEFTVSPRDTVAGALIAAVQVTARDALGSAVTGFGDTVKVAITLGTGVAGATLLGRDSVGAVDGVATFDDLSIDRAGPGYTLTATTGTLTPATSQAFAITPGPTTTTIDSVDPDPTVVGEPYTVNFTVAPVAPGAGPPTGTVTVSDGTDECVATLALADDGV
ncbi:MAG TPA: Ig-like domain-containing protein, partial [Gemmatimonadales bacterium]